MNIVKTVIDRMKRVDEAKAKADKTSSLSHAPDGEIKSVMDYRPAHPWETDLARMHAARANFEYKTLSVHDASGVIVMTYDDPDTGEEMTAGIDMIGQPVSASYMESEELRFDAVIENIHMLDEDEIREFLEELDDEELAAFEEMYDDEYGWMDNLTEEEIELDEISDATMASYKKKAEAQIKELTPWTKKGEYRDLAKNLVKKRQAGLDMLAKKSDTKTLKDFDKETKATDDFLKSFSEEEQLDEVLKKSDPKEKWIAHFLSSDNPKFAGKGKAKRIEMALGAYYAAQKEEVDLSESFKVGSIVIPTLGPRKGEKFKVVELVGDSAVKIKDSSGKIVKTKNANLKLSEMTIEEETEFWLGNWPTIEEAMKIDTKDDGKKKYAKDTDKEDDGEGMDEPGEEDSDVDNDGDSDKSDKYLKNRRKAISKNIKEKSCSKDKE